MLRKRFPGVDIKVTALAKSRQTAADMAQALEKVLLDRKPDLVVWQTGTVDAMRGVDPESFRISLDEGIDHIVDAGADLILMNMQYSPRTETMISLSNYADIMQVVARDREVPLFDRREIMRYWNDNGNFDLNLATKDLTTAYKVHDCLGRALASLVIEAVQSRRHQSETDPVMVFSRPFRIRTSAVDRDLARDCHRTGACRGSRAGAGGGVATEPAPPPTMSRD